MILLIASQRTRAPYTRISKFMKNFLKTGGSIKLWHDYFPNGRIIAVDIKKTNKNHRTHETTKGEYLQI